MLKTGVVITAGLGGVAAAGLVDTGWIRFWAIAQVLDKTAHSKAQYLTPLNYGVNIDDLADRGAPDGREGAGTRGPETCAVEPTLPELTVLSPTVDVFYAESVISTPLDITTRAHPTFQFYMPYTKTTVDAVQLTLLDGNDSLIASIEVEAPETPGILSVHWPSSHEPLLLDTNYRWQLGVDCDRSLTEYFQTDLLVEGFIRRVNLTPEQTQQLENISPTEHIQLLTTFGIWNEALDTLIMAESSDIQSNSDLLEDLLESVELDGLLSHF